MERKILYIEDWEDKKAENGRRYTRFKAREGDIVAWMSCFEKDVNEKLKNLEKKYVLVTVAKTLSKDKSRTYQNIRTFHKEVENPMETIAELEEQQGIPVIKVENDKPKGKGKTEMYVSYVKDLVIGLWDKDWGDKDMVKIAIEIVKKAKEAFE